MSKSLRLSETHLLYFFQLLVVYWWNFAHQKRLRKCHESVRIKIVYFSGQNQREIINKVMNTNVQQQVPVHSKY